MQFLAALAPASPVPGLLGQVRGTRSRYESLADADRSRLARDHAESFRTLLSGRSLAPAGLGAGGTPAEAPAPARAPSLAGRGTPPRPGRAPPGPAPAPARPPAAPSG